MSSSVIALVLRALILYSESGTHDSGSYYIFIEVYILRLSITGSRTVSISFADITQHLPEQVTAIISGGASGVDTIAADYAHSHGIELQVIRPQYNSYSNPRLAPLSRNTDIISHADYCLFFWDGRSRGTAHTISEARRLGRHGKVVIMGGLTNAVMSF